MISFDRFNENARRALFFARVAVSERGGRAICDTHLVLGILRSGGESLSQIAVAETSVQALSACLIRGISSPDIVATRVEIPFDDRVREILDAAVKAAAEAGQHVGPEHLLLATLSVGGEAASCLMQAGIDLGAAERLVRASASESRGPRE